MSMRGGGLIVVLGALVLGQACASEGGCGGESSYPRTNADAALTPAGLRARLTQTGIDALIRALPSLMSQSCGEGDPSSDGCTIETGVDGERVRFFLGAPGSTSAFSGNLAGIPVTGNLRSGGPYPLDREYESNNPFTTPEISARKYCDDTGGTACAAYMALSSDPAQRLSLFCRPPNGAGCGNPGSDYCCGEAAPNMCAGDYTIATCDSPRSSMAIPVAKLGSALHLTLLPGSGIRVVLGCDAPNPDGCTDQATFIQGWVDAVARMDASGNDIACFFRDTPGTPQAFFLKTMRFDVFPDVQLIDGRPHLVVDDAGIQVERVDIQVTDIDSGPAREDPACYDEGWTFAGDASNAFEDCESFCPGVNESFVSDVLSGSVGDSLAKSIARSLVDALGEKALDTAGVVDVASIVPVPGRDQQPVHYLLEASDEALAVTGTGSLGLNFDVDFGFAAEHGSCVAALPEPVWPVLPAPDPGATVRAPDPLTGLLRDEPFDMAFILSDAVLNRAGHELYDSGSLCLTVPALDLFELTSGSLMPTVGGFSIFASGLTDLAPADAPVDVRIIPTDSPRFSFEPPTTGEGSQIQLTWANVGVHLYPWTDEGPMHALAFELDVAAGVTLAPTPDGGIRLVIEQLGLADFVETYNEVGITSEVEGIDDLLEVFLPALVTGEPIDTALTTGALGMPFVPKLRAAERLGPDSRHLGLFLHFCAAPDLDDPDNTLCFEPDSLAARDLGAAITVEPMRGGMVAARNPALVRVHSDIRAADLELAVRAPGLGPYFGFIRAAADGTFALEHPVLAWAGVHTLEVFGRDRTRPGRLTALTSVLVTVDAQAPWVRLERVAGGVLVSAWDDRTPSANLSIAARVEGPGRRAEQPFAPRNFVPARPEDTVSVWARDEAGLESPLVVDSGVAVRTATSDGTEPASCKAAPFEGALVLVLLASAYVARSRRRRS
jgi:hypothetical protein